MQVLDLTRLGEVVETPTDPLEMALLESTWRREGYSLRTDREPKTITLPAVNGVQTPFLLSFKPISGWNRPLTIAVGDNDPSCVMGTLCLLSNTEELKAFDVVGVIYPPGVSNQAAVALISSVASYAVLDAAEYVDKNCPACNEASIKKEMLEALGVRTALSTGDPRNEFCSLSIVKAAIDLVLGE